MMVTLAEFICDLKMSSTLTRLVVDSRSQHALLLLFCP